jgi:TRAP-type C4-dicarboxylate transport system substrate-binding protein
VRVVKRWLVGGRAACGGVALAFLLTGCLGGPGNKVGAPTDTPTILKVANAQGSDELEQVTRQVESLSHGQLLLEVRDPASTRPGAEQAMIDEVRGGGVDVGMVAARAFSSVGIHAYEPLIAPLAVDSYDVEAAVLADHSLVDEMAKGLEPLGLVGIGVIPGPLRVLAAKARPMVSPADLAGATVAISRSQVAEETFRVLGAHTRDIGVDEPINGFDAVESHLSAIAGNSYDSVTPFLTANVVLWPRPIVVFATKERFDRLSADQREVLRSSVGSAVPLRIDEMRSGDAEASGILCRRGARFVDSSAGDMAALRAGVQPVIDRIAQDPIAQDVLKRIEAIPPPGQAPAIHCASAIPAASPASTSQFDGTWQACPTESEIIAAGGDSLEAGWNAGCTSWTFRDGVFTEAGPMAPSAKPGTYEVHDDIVTVHRANGELFIFRWSLFKDRLTFSATGIAGAVSPASVRAVPWKRMGS